MTDGATGPTTSSDDAYAMRPYRDTRPYVGFRPTTPQKCAGCLTLPPAQAYATHELHMHSHLLLP